MSGEDLKVSLEKLRGAAKGWESVSEHLGSAHDKTNGLKQSRIEAGIFQVSYKSFSSAVEYITSVLEAGAAATQKIGPTLRTAADTYEREDATGAHNIANAGGGS